MPRYQPPDLDMLPDGSFRRPPRPPVATRIFIWAAVIAAIAGALSVAAFALWIALILLPVAVAAAVIAWLAMRFQLWRARRDSSARREVWRP